VRPGLVNAASASALDLLGQVVPGLGHGLVAQGDQVEMINGHGGAWKPHPQRLPEHGRGVDRDDLHAEPPPKGAGEEPFSDALLVPAVHDPKHLAGVEVNNGGHPRLMPDPRTGSGVAGPAGGTGTSRDLGGGFEEREPRAGPFLAVPAVLGPQELHGSGDGDVNASRK
jgi:hypothetical protein